MLRCYTAVVEFDSHESAVHAMAILDHFAKSHPAVVQVRPGRPELTLTLPAENLGHAVQNSLALVRATGHRPAHLNVMTVEDLDIAEQATQLPDRPPSRRQPDIE